MLFMLMQKSFQGLTAFLFVLHETETNCCLLCFCRAFFVIAGTELFWLCLLGIVVAGLLPRFVVKVFCQYYRPDDILIGREAEKFGNLTELRNGEIEMNPIFDPTRR